MNPEQDARTEVEIQNIDREAFTELLVYFSKAGEDFDPVAALDTLGGLVPDELLEKFLQPKMLPFARKAALRKMLVMVGMGASEVTEQVMKNIERVVVENKARADAEEIA